LLLSGRVDRPAAAKSHAWEPHHAADQIAAGRFEVSLPRRSDELGQLGQSIEAMADRLSHLIGGQKRFLGDAAHELCAPLSRMRTALGILENRVAPSLTELLKSVEADAAELASLVEEILSFSRAGNHPPMIKAVPLGELIDELIARECSGMPFLNETPRDLVVAADPKLLRRALSNLLRNTQMHAGLQAKMHFSAELRDQMIHLTVSDNGPGVPDEELSRIFRHFIGSIPRVAEKLVARVWGSRLCALASRPVVAKFLRASLRREGCGFT
jgi:two-component system sensor histidine kinase CpxA